MDNIKENVKSKYSYLTSEEIDDLVENAIGWFYALRYPCDSTVNEENRPIVSYMDKWCIKRLCDEIAERNGFNTALGYRENGIQFTFDSAWISNSLKSAIIPIAGIV